MPDTPGGKDHRAGFLDDLSSGYRVDWNRKGIEVRAIDGGREPLRLSWEQVLDLHAVALGPAPPPREARGGAARKGARRPTRGKGQSVAD